MNSKERILKTFRGERTDCVPVAPHWWGVYKYQLASVASTFEEIERQARLAPTQIAEVDINFYETFKPDWFHLSGGALEITPDAQRDSRLRIALDEMRKLESKKAIDEYIEANRLSEAEIRKTGRYSHLKWIVPLYGDSVFIAVNEGNPVCEVFDPHGSLGFAEGLIALAEKPDLVGYLLFRLYELKLDWMKVLAGYGCHGYLGSEALVSADLISPAVYNSIVFPVQKFFYEKVRKLGMEPMAYFLGDINPLIPSINRLGITALLVEESKKGFLLDVVEIRKRLAEDITLFGNLDSVHTLLRGSVEDVERETLRQLEAASFGRFVMANGSPLTFDTPRVNVETMIRVARGG